MDSYRVEMKAAVKIQLADENAEIEPVPTSGGGGDSGARNRSFKQYHQGVQRSVRQHPLEG